MTATPLVTEPATIVTDCGKRAAAAAPRMAAATDHEVSAALRGMAALLAETADTVLVANAADVEAAEQAGTTGALLDRLRLDRALLDAMAESLLDLADVPSPPTDTVLEERPDGLRLIERRRPVGVIGANF